MKKNLLLIGAFALLSAISLSSCNSALSPSASVPTVPKITLTTDMAPAEISFKYASTGEIGIDWGNGILVRYPVAKKLTEAVGTLKGKVIRIYSYEYYDIKGLSFADRQIVSANVSNGVYLDYLDLSHNKLTSIDVSKNAGLKTLDVSYNNLSFLDLSNNEYIDKVVALKNNITSLNVLRNKYLSYIDVSYNNIKKDAMNNFISSLSSRFSDYKSTAIIGLGGNEAPDDAVKNSKSEYWDVFFGNVK